MDLKQWIEIQDQKSFIQIKNDMNSLIVIDFGIAKREVGKLKTKSWTLYFQFNKQDHYAAPEVLDGLYDYKFDVWSTEDILYVTIYSYPQFNGENKKRITFQNQIWDILI